MWEQIHDRRHDLFQTAFAFSTRTIRFNLSSGGQTMLADGIWVSGDYFSALGVPSLLGRVLTAEDDRRGGGPNGPVAVISYGFWQRQFGGAPDVIGRTQNIERVPFTIVGVMPKGFFGAEVGSTFDLRPSPGNRTGGPGSGQLPGPAHDVVAHHHGAPEGSSDAGECAPQPALFSATNS